MNILLLGCSYGVIFFSPWVLGDPENWIRADPVKSPLHIQPEWYFLFAYSILRRVPNKLGGVVVFAIRVLLLFLFPLFSAFSSSRWFYFIGLSGLGLSFFLLTWLGGCPVESPFILLGQLVGVGYFFFILILLWS